MAQKFPTPEAAELAFYDALERCDINQMKSVWSDSDSVVCIHPGALRIEGRDDVVDSFSMLFEDAPAMEFSISDARCQTMDNIAVHHLREEIELDGQLISVMVATNVYQRVEGSWRMMLHHASLEPEPEYDELDYTMETEVPTVLH